MNFIKNNFLHYLFPSLIILLFLDQIESQCPNSRNHLRSYLPQTKKGQYSFFTWGIDLFSANTLTADTLKCLQNTGSYTTLGLFLGFSTFETPPLNPVYYSAETLQIFLANSFEKELILYTNFNETSEVAVKNYIEGQLDPFINYADKIKRVWIRTNLDSECPNVTDYINCQRLSLSSNLDTLNISLNIVSNLGFAVGIYTNKNIWNLAFNDGTNSIKDFSSTALLFDDTDTDEIEPSFDNFKSFGPWKEASAKMSAYWYIDGVCCWPGQITWKKNGDKIAKIVS